ncbi:MULTISPECIES: SpoIIE family protein phosphatase [Streptomyces]|uniref:SpoIIE family protein phosphatase n=1 Tax=Streptomyces mordarskii TaxID=1226758 RepID=A0ABP3NI57_9ACTN|nr:MULTISPECIES: SpoIIE family protein phosphatase [unclassified Streptomyces]AJZ83706.1 SpoIIE family protein phosphatase [Streptomyces sp. AgN23]RSS36255.1 PAS domain S-box protein [Streptomyces sp. WAC05858]WTA85502.1 SpoIIE family protein phosphatase [Streptomyces antimycoticus]WTB03933.1 SpoIIE family protein phosphatase [Streptomyces antimycoticus]
MTTHDRVDQEDGAGIGSMATAPGGVLDLLRVAAVALDVEGRIALWSPEAEQLFGYRAAEALGRRADKLLVHPKDRSAAVELFARVRAGDTWAGVFPVRRPDGSTLKVDFRTMGLRDAHGEGYALGLAADEGTVRRLETDLAVSGFLIGQSPVGLAVFDTELRWLRANPALQRMNSITEPQVRGLRVGEALPGLDCEAIEAAMRHVLESGEPLLDQQSIGRTPADPDHDHAWSESYYRLEDPSGRILGVAVSIMDISRRHRETSEIAEARERLAVIADASVRVGTTLDLRRTAQELADVTVPRLADLAAVDVLDSVVHREATPRVWTDGSARFRALAVAAGYPTDAVHAADPVGEIARYDPTRLITQCVREARPILVPHVTEQDVRRIARDDDAGRVLLREGVHSYIAAPLIARGSVLGTLSLHRTINPRPFDEEDLTLACELAIRAALCIDNARLYARERDAALTLQRSLLSQQPRDLDGLEIASRYLPAVSAAGGDWFDVLPLPDGRVGLVVGDVMGKGIHAAAIMGQLRTATRAFSRLELPPAQVLCHLDEITPSLGESIATCLYAVCDPRTGRCEMSTAGHLPPVLVHPGGDAELIDLPTGAPLGVGGVPFASVERELAEGALLALFTDGLVEKRHQSLDVGLHTLVQLLRRHQGPLERICDQVLAALHGAPDDDVALLLARLRCPRLPEASVVTVESG